MALRLAEDDVVFFVEEFVFTFDPRNIDTPYMPMVLFEKQKEVLRWFSEQDEKGKDGILEKSRDAGATWLACAWAVWCWLFKPGSAIGFGSRKLELVDKKDDPLCIFSKIRDIIYNLPPWLLSAKAHGFDSRRHDSECKIVNPANGSTISGEGGSEIGRGGRTRRYFIDEAAFLPHPELTEKAMTANSRSRIDISTPNGSNNVFARKRKKGAISVRSLHWKDDDRKSGWCIVPASWRPRLDGENDLVLFVEDILSSGPGGTPPPKEIPGDCKVIYPWRELIGLTKEETEIAQEYEIDYSASLEGVIIPEKWLRACVGLILKPSKQRVAGFDVAGRGSAENAFICRAGPVVEVVESWGQGDSVDAAVEVMDLMQSSGASVVFYDSIGVGDSIAGTWRRAGRRVRFNYHGINVGTAPSNRVWKDGKTSKEKFDKLKGELWWTVRERAHKTYLKVTAGHDYPDDEILSLPPGEATERLISQLSNVVSFESNTGKILVEKKEDLAKRGVPSPDLAEALVLSFAPVPKASKGVSGGRPAPSTRPSAPTAPPLARKPPAAPVKYRRRTSG